jgi:hypothetical protein
MSAARVNVACEVKFHMGALAIALIRLVMPVAPERGRKKIKSRGTPSAALDWNRGSPFLDPIVGCKRVPGRNESSFSLE